MRVLLISFYELGRQPFGLASPAAWLRAEGHDVTQTDLSRTPLPQVAAAAAELIAFFLPMHTATGLFAQAVEGVRGLNPTA
ncbi:MAG: radical SAM protein, partial [Acidobacteriia bacterium]|nr:radical SAM protein [Terriglobia bacterium]